jgi:membrane-associated phospholipid phosphatase
MPLKPLLLSMLVSICLNALINMTSKISLHASAFAGALTVFFFLFGSRTLFLMLPLLFLVMWSRVKLKQHTPDQVIGGALVSGSVTAMIFGRFFT